MTGFQTFAICKFKSRGVWEKIFQKIVQFEIESGSNIDMQFKIIIILIMLGII